MNAASFPLNILLTYERLLICDFSSFLLAPNLACVSTPAAALRNGSAFLCFLFSFSLP
jgi:hypothetical protein